MTQPEVLFLCTHNAARSILAEAMFNHLAARAGSPLRAASAGSAPSGVVHPLALEVLAAAGIDARSAASKSWDQFGPTSAVKLRVVITVCDAAAAESCPVWSGSPVRVHWGFPDPSRALGDAAAQRTAFELTRQAFGYKALQVLALDFDQLDDPSLALALNAIGGR